MRANIFILLLCLGLPGILLAQKKVRYTSDFYFSRGVYPSIEHWKNNAPVKTDDIITKLDKTSSKFFQLLFAQESFRYPEKTKIVYVKPEELFGYSDGRSVYYSTEYKFEIIGAISQLKEVGEVDSYSSFIKPGESYEANRSGGSGKLYILDYETGNFFKCKPKEVIELFKRDAELYQDYKNAKGSKKDRISRFIKEYNFRNPIYFPE